MESIANTYQSPATAEEFLDALNSAKVREFGAGVWPFTMAQIRYFSDPRNNSLWYIPHSIPKKSGGTREILSPVWMLKMLLASAGNMLLEYYEAPESVMGFVPGRSIADNASNHVGKNYVYNADLKDFFPSITRKRVKAALMRPPFSFGADAAHMLSGLCCTHADLARSGRDIYLEMKRKQWAGDGGKRKSYRSEVPATLPQGAPSSPVLSNAVCTRLDCRLAGLARQFEVTYTRYADDITFSSNHNVFKEGYSFLKEFRKIIADEGFTLNEEKLRLQKKDQRQEVTGLIVNNKVNVCRKYIRSIGSLLYIWERYGVDTAYARFLKHNIDWRKTEDNVFHDCVLFRPHMVETIQGRLAYIRMIRGKDDPVWSRLNDRFQKLKNQYEARGVVGDPTRILHSWSIKRFEQLSGIKLRYGGLNDNFLWIEDPHHHYFFIEKNGYRTFVHPSRYCKTRLERVLNKKDLVEYERLKSEFRIGLCVNNPPAVSSSMMELLNIDPRQEIERRGRKILHTYSRMAVYWNIFRRPPDIEDLPY